jgi:hypothetical protein
VDSWRETASGQVQADLDELLSAATAVATKKLAEHGHFSPFGGAITDQGTVKMIAVQPVPGEAQPDTADLTALCRSAMTRKRDHLRAAAVVALTERDGEHAIRIDLEHRDGIALHAVVPYHRKRFRHAVHLGAAATEPASAGLLQIWA